MSNTFAPTLVQRLAAVVATRSISYLYNQRIPSMTVYSGATISRITDDLGNIYRAFQGRNNVTRQFGFFISKNGVNIRTPRSPIPFSSGRGSLSADGTWIAHDEKGGYNEGPIPLWNEVDADHPLV